MAHTPPPLAQFEARASEDELKLDLELTCTRCDTLVCDIQASDTLDVLVSVAEEHRSVCAAD